MKKEPITIAALYKFFQFGDYKKLREPLLRFCRKHKIKGTLLLAKEGINGTIAGSDADIKAVIDFLRQDQRFDGLECKFSYCEAMPFLRTKVRLKQEIVNLRVDGVSPVKNRGTYIEAKDWNSLISRDDVVLVDTRNNYEYEIGSFKGALNPETDNFHELPQFVEKNLDPKRHKKVAMFCTGGIRCEKSTAYLKGKGFEEVYHLKGGILQYLEEIKQEDSLWEGECFVFDDRVAVNHDLEKSDYVQCFACRMPVSPKDQESNHYVKGVSCLKCYGTQSSQNKSRAVERQRQVTLAKEKGIKHLGR